jgi:hypothetical protein
MLKLLITIEQQGTDERLQVHLTSTDETTATLLETTFAALLRKVLARTIETCREDKPN